MTTNDRPLDEQYSDIELVGEKKLSWFDVSCMGTGEMLFTAGWAWIAYIASLYGIKWTIVGFVIGAVMINIAWWLYREMVTAAPEPGSLQSYGREARLFPVGSAYFILYAPVYALFMWLELLVAQGLFSLIFPGVPGWIWPYVVLIPVVALNLLGHQITGKVQAFLVVCTLIGDVVLAIFIWSLIWDSGTWAANWASPSPINWLTVFTITGLWVGIMAGILEVQQVVVDEWHNFERSRDVGLLTAAWQLWGRQLPLALGVLGSAPLVALVAMPVPTVGVVHKAFGQYGSPLFYLAMFSMLIATYTTLSVFFMGMGRIVSLYAQQGALPRVLGRYSTRSVPWVAILLLAGLALIGVYWRDFTFVQTVLSTWSATLYFLIAVLFLRMRARKNLERPVKVKYGVPLAVVLLLLAGLVAAGVIALSWEAAVTWFVIVLVVALYDKLVVPRTKRGSFYREQVLRERTSATRLD